MKHRKIIILSLIAVMFAAVISAITVITPQTAKADSTPFTINYEKVFYDSYATTSDEQIMFEMSLTGHNPSGTVEDNALFAFMWTTDYSKYQKAISSGIAIESADSPLVSMTPNTIYAFTPDSLRSGLKAYCDDVFFLTMEVNFPTTSAYRNKKFIMSSSYYVDSGTGYMLLPSNLNSKYYYYCVKLSYSRNIRASMDHTSYFNEKLTSSMVSSIYTMESPKSKLYEYLEEGGIADVRREAVQRYLGIYTGNKAMPVTVKYKEAKGFSDIQDIEESFTMDSLYAQDKGMAAYYMYRALDGKDDITSFNCVYRDCSALQDGTLIEYREKIVLQAKDFSYVYNGCESATITVNYESFQYSNFCIRVQNNDPDPKTKYMVDIYSASVSKSGSYYTLSFNYVNINKWLLNQCGWLVTLKKELFSASGVIVDNNEAPSPLTVTVGDDALTVGFNLEDESRLANLSICVVAEIVANNDVNYSVNYKQLTVADNGEITVSDAVSEQTMKLNSFYQLSTFDNFMTSHGTLINDSVKLYDADLSESDVNYFVPDSVLLTKPVFDSDSQTYSATVTVFYTYRSIFRVKVNGNFLHFVQPNNSDNKYTMSDLLYTVPDGYRISDIGCTEGAYVTFDDRNPDQAYVTFNSYSSSASLNNVKVIDVILTVTDKLLVSVDYLENYMYKDVNGATKPSGFAVRKNGMKEVEAASFADVYSPTEAEIKTFLGVDDLTVIGTLGKVDLKNSTVKKQGAVYEIELAYWHATLKVTQSTGEFEFLDVPLLSYGAWCEEIDRDWSLLALNTEENTVFTSNGDVDKSDLYGYFYVSVFKEQVKNLDSLFAGYSADGCRTFFTAKKVVGSDLYKFCKNLGVAGFILSLGGTATVQAIGEALNDDYGTYYSYFSFIDGSSVLSYAANNKADDYFDNDSAFDNTVEDVKDTVTNWWNSNNAFVKAMKIAFGIAGVALILLVILKILPVFIKAFGKIGKSVEEIRPDRRPKKRKRK